MKISELVKRTRVAKETIHYYIREGVLKKPRKSGVNSANYNESYVDQIRIIKELRDNYFLPLPIIKKIFKRIKKLPRVDQTIYLLHNKYFRPLNVLLSDEVKGEHAFLEETGMSSIWLSKMEQWGIITPEIQDDQKIYSSDNVIIARLMVDMDRYGIGPKDGLDPENLRQFTDMFQKMFRTGRKEFLKTHLGKLSAEEFKERSVIATELMGIYTYLLYRKLANDARRAAGRDKI